MKKIKKLSGLGLSVLAALVSSSAMASQKDQTPVSKPTNVHEILVNQTLSKIKAARDGKKSAAIIDSHKRTLLSTLGSIGQVVPSGQDAEVFALNYLKELSTKSLKTIDTRENTEPNTKSFSKVGMASNSRDDVAIYMQSAYPKFTSHSTTSNEVKNPFGGSDVRKTESSNVRKTATFGDSDVRKTEISNVRKSSESSDSETDSAQISEINSEIKNQNSKILEAKINLEQIIQSLEESGKQLKTENTLLKEELEQFKKLPKENLELNAKIEKMSILARQKDEKITTLDAVIGVKEKEIVELKKYVEGKNKMIDELFASKESDIKELQDEFATTKKECDQDFLKLENEKNAHIEYISKELEEVTGKFKNMIESALNYSFTRDIEDENGKVIKQVGGKIGFADGAVEIIWEK
jgi:hypothetical protein